jgi:hypothetical protein
MSIDKATSDFAKRLRSMGISGRIVAPGKIEIETGTIYEFRGGSWICSELTEDARNRPGEIEADTSYPPELDELSEAPFAPVFNLEIDE